MRCVAKNKSVLIDFINYTHIPTNQHRLISLTSEKYWFLIKGLQDIVTGIVFEKKHQTIKHCFPFDYYTMCFIDHQSIMPAFWPNHKIGNLLSRVLTTVSWLNGQKIQEEFIIITLSQIVLQNFMHFQCCITKLFLLIVWIERTSQ